MKKYLSFLTVLFCTAFLIPVPSHAQGQAGTTLSATKTATGHLIKKYTWTIDKSVTPTSWELFKGDSGTSRYTISVTKDAGTEQAYVDGEVCVTNGGDRPTEGLKIVDELQSKSGGEKFTTFDSFEIDLGAFSKLNPGESHCYQYNHTFTPTGDNNYRNMAVVTITNHSGSLEDEKGPEPKADFSLPTTPTEINGSINVDDTNGGTWQFSSSGSVNYDKTFTCDGDGGEHKNTATIRETKQSDDASVQVNCHQLEVSKTARTSYVTTYDWTINKIGDKSSLTLSEGQTFLVNYDVTTSATSQNSDWSVEGNITVHNPASIAAVINGVSDLLTGDLTATVECPVTFPYSLPAGESLECTYTKDLPDGTNRTNTATATLKNVSYDKDNKPTDSGTTDFTGTASVDFGAADVTMVDECIDVTDDKKGTLGTVCYNELPKTYEYTLTVGPYESCGKQQYVNTASFISNDTRATGKDDWMVNVDVPCTGCTLTIGYWKNHAGFGPQPDMLSELLPKTLGCWHSWWDWNTCINGAKTYTVTTAERAVSFLSMKVGTPSNGITKLYAQLLAAKLNMANGATNITPTIKNTISDADHFLKTHNEGDWGSMGKSDKNKVLGWMAVLDGFNNGNAGVPHCSE